MTPIYPGMKTKILKIFIVCFSSAIFCLIAIETIRACSFFDMPDNKDYSVFAPEIIHQPDQEPFFLSYHLYYGYDEGYTVPETVPTMQQRNTMEWSSFFNPKIDLADLQWLIYQSSALQLDVIRRNFAGEKVSI